MADIIPVLEQSVLGFFAASPFFMALITQIKMEEVRYVS